MRQSLAIILALVLATPVLSGCLGVGGDSDDGSSGSGLEGESKATVSTETGGIEGLVTDAAVQAVANVTVTIEELGESTATTTDGSFAFSEVTPGTYTLRFEKEGFIGAEREVDVVAGEVATIELTIAHEPSITPYMQSFEWTGFMEASAGVAAEGSWVSTTGLPAQDAHNHRTNFYYDLQPNAWGIVTEVDWEPESPSADRLLASAEPQGFNSAWKVAFVQAIDTAPIISYTDRARLAEIVENFQKICNGEENPETTSNQNSEAYCGHNPVEKGEPVHMSIGTQASDTAGSEGVFGYTGVGVSAQQEVSIFATTFYNAPPACDDYSIVEDNLCGQMESPPEEDPYGEVAGNFTPNNSSGNSSGG